MGTGEALQPPGRQCKLCMGPIVRLRRRQGLRNLRGRRNDQVLQHHDRVEVRGLQMAAMTLSGTRFGTSSSVYCYLDTPLAANTRASALSRLIAPV